MALEEYKRKRDFARTPEPAGGAPSGAGLAFVVQKHAARALHYDLRLEHEGVMLSWAVPKGPSLDPADKRLAMHVEDHPLDYAGFEGVIPAGEYGGGTVMVWDRGTWEPVGDAAAMLAKGDLKLRLEGTKLAGEWALVRMKPRPGERGESWLLIKHRDEHAQPRAEHDVTSEEQSALTGRTMEQIAEAGELYQPPGSDPPPAAPDPSGVTGAVLTGPPGELPFALCMLAPTPPDGPGWLHEVKLDGYRLLLRLEKDRARALTRSGADWTERFPDIAEALRALPVTEAVLDGEAVVQGPGGRSDFGALQQSLSAGRAGAIVFFAFDLLRLDGYDLRQAPIEERKRTLEALLETAPKGSPLRYLDHITGSGEVFHSAACGHELEGSVSKRAGSPYPSGRSRAWVKVKCLLRQEFVVGGWTDPAGSRGGFGALLLGVGDGRGLRYAGRVGSGFTAHDLTAIRARLDALAAEESPFAKPPRLKTAHWVRPELVAEVAFTEWTREGALRHPVFVGLREDKPAAEVVREESAPAPRLTNPDRVLWPEMGVTKSELAAYWETVAERALPQLGGRLLTFVRCPQGHEKQCFYQKHVEAAFPDAVRTMPVPTRQGDKDFAYVEDVDGLLGLVQMGVLEVHDWGSRIEAVETPDRITFDLDPGPDVTWEQVVEAAVLVRDTLAGVGLAAFAKTTGGKGLHVVVPTVAERGWDEVRDFARSVAEAIAETKPERYTSKMAKVLRPGRVFVDYVRNTRESTSVGAYSPRARAGAPVSTPVSWEELAEAPDPAAFTVRTVPGRLADPDPWAGYEAARRRLPGSTANGAV